MLVEDNYLAMNELFILEIRLIISDDADTYRVRKEKIILVTLSLFHFPVEFFHLKKKCFIILYHMIYNYQQIDTSIYLVFQHSKYQY